MKCPVCQHEMIQSKVGWLCENCGHLESSGTKKTVKADSVPEAAVSATPDDIPAAAEVAPVAIKHVAPPDVPVPPVTPDVPVPPPVPDHIPQPPLDTSVPLPHKTHKSRKLLVIGSIVVLMLLILGGAGTYAFILAPRMALADYLTKLTKSHTGTYAATVSFKSDSDGTLSATASGSYDVSNATDPKVDVKLAGTYNTADPTGLTDPKIGGEVITRDKTLFFKISSLGIFSAYAPVDVTKDWYKLPLDDNLLSSQQCYTNTKNSGALLGQQVLTKLPLKDNKRVGLFETIIGHSTSHFQGTLDVAKLQTAIDAANKDLPADCKITTSPDDFKNVTVGYDLWSSSNFDRLKVTLTDTDAKSTTELTFDSTDYNKPVTITAPADPKSIDELIKLFYGGDEEIGQPGEGTSDNLSATEARDAQRKADLRNVKTALETYFNDMNEYPNVATYATLSTPLVPTYIKTLPVDPVGGTAASPKYTYKPVCAGTPKTCTAYTLSATLENTSDSSASGGLYTVQSVN